MPTIVHLDADAFFAAVEQAADPKLRGKPIAVGGERRGIIASASYEARKFGVFTPMPTARARKLCPKLIVLPGDFDRYEQFSNWMFGYCYDFTPYVEQTSIDEGYFDLTANRRKSPAEIALTIRKAISQKLKISVSEGIASNKLVSAVASKLTKPAGFKEVQPGGEVAFLHPLPNQWLPGIGSKTSVRLNAAGLVEIRHIAATPVEMLELLLGQQAFSIRQFAHGIDERPLVPAREPQKSFSQQETFGSDVTDEEYTEAVLRRMADHLFAKVREESRSIRTLTVKVRYNDMAEDQVSESLLEPTDLETDVYGRLHTMLQAAWKRRVSLRLVSLKLSNMYDGRFRTELPLEVSVRRQDARARLALVIDELRRSRGQSTILRGHDFRLRDAPREALARVSHHEIKSPTVRRTATGPSVAALRAGGGAAGRDVPRSGEKCGLAAEVPGFTFQIRKSQIVNRKSATYVPLRCHSHYSFLDSTLSPTAIVELAKQHNLTAVAVTDTGNLHGVVEFVQAARAAGIKPIIGAEIRVGKHPLLLYAANATGYSNLCRLLSQKPKPEFRSPNEYRTSKSESVSESLHSDFGSSDFSRISDFGFRDLSRLAGLLAVSSDPTLADCFPGRFYQVVAKGGGAVVCPSVHYATPEDRWKWDILQSIRTLTLLDHDHPEKRRGGRYHFRTPAEMAAGCAEHPEWIRATHEIAERCEFEFPFGKPQFPAFSAPDGSTSRESLRKLVLAGFEARYGGDPTRPRPSSSCSAVPAMPNAECRNPKEARNSKTESTTLCHSASLDLTELNTETQNAQRNTEARQCSGFGSSDLIRSSEFGFRNSPSSPGYGEKTAEDENEERGRGRVPVSRIRAQIEEELGIIADVGYEDYFLITWDFLQECRRRGIEWITRGSAADSLVCYCLGISSVCPIRFGLYFRRFLNKERMALNKLPDIDIDFAHDFKDDVVKLILEKYGPGHCAVVGGFSTFQARSAFAEVAKVLGVGERDVRKFTEHFPWGFGGGWVPDEPAPKAGDGLIELLKARPETSDLPFNEEPYRTALMMADFLDGMPRYPKMHPCGLVLSRQPMHELTPTFVSQKGWSTTHFDMDAVEAIGLVKMDILAQGGLAVMRDVKTMLAKRGVEVDLERCCARSMPNAECRMPKEVRNSKSESTENAPHSEFGNSDLIRNSKFEIRSSPSHSALRTPRFDDAEVWDMIASGGARAVHHIESPAMTSLCRMCNVREIDGLIAIVSVIRPGAANEGKKLSFTRRYQGMEPVVYPHPSLEACLRSTYGLVVYEEHILQISEAFAGLAPGRADVLRRALNKQKRAVIEEIRGEFFASARARGHAPEKIEEVWGLATGFSGYAFCKAHSTAYGVEAYQSAWLKRYFPAEFMAAVLTNGKGFYDPLVYVLECHRLGLTLLPPSVNEPGPGFAVVWESGNRARPSSSSLVLETETKTTEHEDEGRRTRTSETSSIRVPLTRVKGLTTRTSDRLLAARENGPFTSMGDFFRRVAPTGEELEAMIRVGAFDEFGETRARQFWQAQHLRNAECRMQNAELDFGETGRFTSSLNLLPSSFLREPTRRERLEAETHLFGFAVSGHPLELFDHVAWDTYCPVNRLGEFVGDTVTTCGLVVEQRTHHQITGEPMKFLTLADWTGMAETELFAQTYRSYGLATVRYPVLEIEARIEPFDNHHGFSLRVLRAGKPRMRT